MVSRLLENTFVNQKIESVPFCSCPQARLSPGSYHHSRRKLPISPEQHFLKICFSPAERGKNYGAEKMTKIKLARVLVTSFDKFHLFCNLNILISVLLCHNLDLSMLEYEGSLT